MDQIDDRVLCGVQDQEKIDDGLLLNVEKARRLPAVVDD
tara:strand:- start:684 stop:800 length:117 start_codon:yes stop_codon:yes gene_type:complete